MNKPGKDPLLALKEIRKSQLKLLEALPVPESVLKVLQSQNNLYDEAMMQIVSNKELPLPLKQKVRKLKEKEIIMGSAEVFSDRQSIDVS